MPSIKAARRSMGVWLHIPRIINTYSSSFNLIGTSPFLAIINLALLAVIAYMMFFSATILKNYFGYPRRLKAIELISPGYEDLKLEDYEALFARVYGLGFHSDLISKLMRKRPTLSFEVEAAKERGIRFLVLLPEDLIGFFKKDVRASLPGVTIKTLDGYSSRPIKSPYSITEFKLKKPFFNSLKESNLSTLAYQASFMDLKDSETMTFQMNVSAISPAFNIRTLKKLEKNNLKPRSFLAGFFRVIYKMLKLVLGSKDVSGSSPTSKIKLESPLFRVNLRLLIECENKSDLNIRLRLFKSSLALLANPGRQMLIAKPSLSKWLLERQYVRRLPSLFSRSTPILSADELANLYHFPGFKSTGSSATKRTLSRTLPASIEFKSRNNDVLLGENRHGGEVYPFGLTKSERARHLYVIGGTGNGKTTMLNYMISQDVKSGKGLMVVDPHGDLAENLLGDIPKSRIKDVIYFNPSDTDYPVSLNLLELTTGLSRKDYILERDRITESIISIFRKTFEQNDDGSAYRIERLLRNAAQTALYVENATLFTVSRILSDRFYRFKVIENLKDESLKRFWMEEFNKAGDYQRIKMSLGPLSRLERFERNLSVSRVIGSPKSTLDFDEVINSKKILICNLSKGALGEDVSNLLGSLLLAKLQLAALKRQLIDEKKRGPFYLYVDEFQNYANQALVNMFSEARKFGLNLVIAQQSPAQISDKSVLDVIMDNVGSIVAFRSKSSLSEKLLLPQFAPYISKNEISNLPKYSFYAKLAADEPLPPVSGRTVILRSPKSNVTNLIIESSRQLYASHRVSEALSI